LEPFGAGRKPQNGIYGKDEKTSLSLNLFVIQLLLVYEKIYAT
jgi:hypothetical protein